MLRVFSVFLFLFLTAIADPSAFAAGEGSASRWQEAQSFYDAGKFEEAFQSLSAQPSTDDPTYFYNLGTIAYRLGRAGAALGYFEKANRLKHHDPDIRSNLELVRSDLGRTLGSEKLDPASTWTENLADQVSLEELRSVLGLMGLILSLFWIRTYWKSRDLKQTLLRPAALIGSAVLALLVGLYGVETGANAHFPAIALARQSVRSGPADTYSELSQIDAGVKVRLLGTSSQGTLPGETTSPDPWLQVRYSRDGVGWVRSSGFLVIN